MRKRWLIIAGLLLALAASAFVVRGQANEHVDVVSIKTLDAFQNLPLLSEAWALPVAVHYPHPPLYQPNPSACGPTSLANVLHSVGKEEATSRSVADQTQGCALGICLAGLTLDQLATAAQSVLPGWKVEALHELTLDQFRDELRHANELERRYVVNFHRAQLFGQGGGHHSPIGGYLEASDLVLVLDVNERFEPWLVSSERLYEAMQTVDSASGLRRGLLRLQQ